DGTPPRGRLLRRPGRRAPAPGGRRRLRPRKTRRHRRRPGLVAIHPVRVMRTSNAQGEVSTCSPSRITLAHYAHSAHLNTMDLLAPQVTDYLSQLSRPGDPVLERLEREAQAERFPIVGPAAGQFCHLAARMVGARRVFELGSGFGYSTLWFAR